MFIYLTLQDREELGDRHGTVCCASREEMAEALVHMMWMAEHALRTKDVEIVMIFSPREPKATSDQPFA